MIRHLPFFAWFTLSLCSFDLSFGFTELYCLLIILSFVLIKKLALVCHLYAWEGERFDDGYFISMVPIGGGSTESVLSDRWIEYTKSRRQLLHRKYLLYDTGCR